LLVFLEDRNHLFSIRYAPARSRRLELLKKEVNAAGHDGGQSAAGASSDILKCVRAPSRRERNVARASVDFATIHYELVFAFNDVPPLVMLGVAMQRRALQRPRLPFEDGERAASVATRNLNPDLIAEHMDSMAMRGWHNERASGRIGAKHALSLLNR
jgi:hypothetical protein